MRGKSFSAEACREFLHGIEEPPDPLPLLAGPARLKLTLVALPFAVFIGGLSALGSWGVLSRAATTMDSAAAMVAVLVLPFLVLLLVGGIGVAATCATDALRPSPLLILNSVGLCDRRADEAVIAWDDIRRATVYRSRAGLVAGVCFLLRRPGRRRSNPFHPGLLWVAWTYPGDFHLPLMLLDRDAAMLGRNIVALVRQHGGQASEQRKDEILVRLLRIGAKRLRRRWRPRFDRPGTQVE